MTDARVLAAEAEYLTSLHEVVCQAAPEGVRKLMSGEEASDVELLGIVAVADASLLRFDVVHDGKQGSERVRMSTSVPVMVRVVDNKVRVYKAPA